MVLIANLKLCLKDHKIDYVVLNERMNIDQVFDMYKPDYIINGCMYDMSSGLTITNSIDENERHGVYFSRKGIGITSHGRLVESTVDEGLKNPNIVDFVGGAPTLLSRGNIEIDDIGLSKSFINTIRPRSVIGFNKTHFYLFSPDVPQNIKTLATACKSLGMTTAINLDGGGSTILGRKVGDKLEYLGSYTERRKNANWILVYKNERTVKKMNKDISMVKIRLEDNKKLLQEFDGVIIDGVSYAPVRKVFESQNCQVSYDSTAQQVTVKK